MLYTSSIDQLLIDMSIGDPVQSWIDPLGLGTLGASGVTLSRLCPVGMTYQVDSYGTHEMYEPDTEVGLRVLGRTGSQVMISLGGFDDTSVFSLGSSTLSEFALGDYPILADTAAESFVSGFDDFDTLDVGLAVAGSVTLDSCRIDERDPFDGIDPWIITVSGAFEGVMEVAHHDGRDPTLHDFNGHFALPLLVSLDDEETISYLESVCEGGIPRGGGLDGSSGLGE
jgi:hypothetical protein